MLNGSWNCNLRPDNGDAFTGAHEEFDEEEHGDASVPEAQAVVETKADDAHGETENLKLLVARCVYLDKTADDAQHDRLDRLRESVVSHAKI